MIDRDRLSSVWTNLGCSIRDFSIKAERLFKANNWTWGSLGNPTAMDIECTLERLSWEAYKEAEKDGNHSCCSTGRLQVRFAKYGRGWTAAIELIPLWNNI